MMGILFQNVTGTRMVHVPYRGDSLALQDLIGGQIDLMFTAPSIALPQVRKKAIKVYGATAGSRLAAAPDIPTLDEAGLAGFFTATWRGMWVPKGTPRDVVARLNAAVVEALADPTCSMSAPVLSLSTSQHM